MTKTLQRINRQLNLPIVHIICMKVGVIHNFVTAHLKRVFPFDYRLLLIMESWFLRVIVSSGKITKTKSVNTKANDALESTYHFVSLLGSVGSFLKEIIAFGVFIDLLITDHLCCQLLFLLSDI